MTRLAAIVALSALPVAAVAAPCPEPKPEGGRIEVAPTRLAAAHTSQVIAGGPVVLAGCGAVDGDGHVPSAPQLNVMLAGGATRALEFLSVGDCDTVLVVATAEGGWHYDDDGGGGSHARVVIDAAPEGRYDVWIGTWDIGTCRARLELRALEPR